MTLAAPICFLVFCQMSLAFITLLFAGKIDNHTLAGAGLGNTFYNVFQFSVMYGYSSIMDTYGPQVYGTKDKNLLGTVLAKALLQGVLIWLLVVGPYLNLVYLMRVVSPHEETLSEGEYDLVLMNAELYLRITCMIGLLDFTYDVISKYLSIQGQVTVVYCLAVVMVGVHILYNYLIVIVGGYGIEGLAVACILTRVTSLLCTFLYVVYKRKILAWTSLTPLVFKDWSEMMKLGVSGSINMFAELGMFEISAFFSQFAGITSLNSIIITFQICSLAFAVSMGIAYSASVLIGKSLAVENKADAQKIVHLSMFNVILVGLIMMVLAYGLRFELPKIFSNDESVRELTASILWIGALTYPIDGLQTVLSRGVLVGFGKQRFIAIVLVVLSYGIATPFIIASVFLTKLGPKGILLGFLIFAVLSACVNGFRVSKLNYEEEINEVKKRVASTAAKDDVVALQTINNCCVDTNHSAVNVNYGDTDGEFGNGLTLDMVKIGDVSSNLASDIVSANVNVVDNETHKRIDANVNYRMEKSGTVMRKFMLFVASVIWAGAFAGVSCIKG